MQITFDRFDAAITPSGTEGFIYTIMNIGTDSKVSAKVAGLNHVSDSVPGIRRIGDRNNFRYISPSGRTIRNPSLLKRIQSVVIPPAWNEVWISTDPLGHIQAIGRDARGRKQYRYHPRWRETRDSTKYDRMALFGKTLPKIRTRLSRDLGVRDLRHSKVLATIVRLLDSTSMRVGNEEYSRHNHSFGLTTLRNRHVAIRGETLNFFFRGKGGIQHRISLEDRVLAKVVRRLRELPGYELFQFIDEDGAVHSINSSDVNNYIRDISGEEFTAKDFRTWNGTVLAAAALGDMEPASSPRITRKNIVSAVESVAAHLGNTVAICRKSYIHPVIFDAYETRTLARDLKKGRRVSGLSRYESGVLHLLSKCP